MKPEEIVSGRFYELSGSVTVDREDTVFYRVPVQAVREGIHLLLKVVDTKRRQHESTENMLNIFINYTDELLDQRTIGWIFEDLSYDECGGYIVDDPTGDAFMLDEWHLQIELDMAKQKGKVDDA